jgi:predicted RNA-binding Zn-ribbon protein involved in translation (DUF1610 family)
MHSLRSYEGYLLIDHRNSPGVPDEIMVNQGLTPGSGKGLFESATFTCPYCERVIVMNPDRSRPRAFDRKTNHYICDPCDGIRSTGVEMKTMKQLTDELLNKAAKAPQSETFQSSVIVIGV